MALSSRNSQSYCEQFLAVLKHNKLATIVGTPTSGANGNVVLTPLPGDIEVYWTGMLVRQADKSRFQGGDHPGRAGGDEPGGHRSGPRSGAGKRP